MWAAPPRVCGDSLARVAGTGPVMHGLHFSECARPVVWTGGTPRNSRAQHVAEDIAARGPALRIVNARGIAMLILKWPHHLNVGKAMKGKMMIKFWILSATTALLATAALAQDATQEFAVGREEYLRGCAACHGEAADGNGEIASMFKTPVPDLTGIAARNDGVFPLLKVIQAIDGRAVIRGHGNPMPVFGNRFRSEASRNDADLGAESLARGRVLELALYIQSIQK